MGSVETRNNWNDLLQRINNLAQNPPDGCSAPAKLTPVDPGHIWTKTDISKAQNVLKAVCKDNTFAAPEDTPDLWLQKTLDDITAAINKGWCGCGGGGGGGGGGGIPPSPSGHWVIVLCDCASGTIQTTDAEGNCIPFCQGCVGPFRYSINVVWSGTDGGVAQRVLASYNANEYDSCTHAPLAPYRLLALETWTAMVTGHTRDSWIGSCTC